MHHTGHHAEPATFVLLKISLHRLLPVIRNHKKTGPHQMGPVLCSKLGLLHAFLEGFWTDAPWQYKAKAKGHH